MEAPIHRVRVKDLVGASYRGEFFEIKIEYIGENEEFNCPSTCLMSKPRCYIKDALMEKPDKFKLICSVVIIRVKNISTKPLEFQTSKYYCKAMDSQGNLYATASVDSVSQQSSVGECNVMFKQRFGTFFESATEIPDGVSARFLLRFPTIPKDSKIIGLFIKCGDHRVGKLETFDFRVSQESIETMAIQGISNVQREDKNKDLPSNKYEISLGQGIKKRSSNLEHSLTCINESSIAFAVSSRCWVYPFCYLLRKPEECLLVKASGFRCETCTHRVVDEELAEKIYAIYKIQMAERERKHYEFLKTKFWREKIRPKILKFDEYRCIICEESVQSKKAHVHHVIDFSADEDLSPRNLVTLCIQCHSKLHPVFPEGMWKLGWPSLEKVKSELKDFYEKVRQTSVKYKNRLKAPLEHLMMHLCLICPYIKDCEIGKFTQNDITNKMEMFKVSS